MARSLIFLLVMAAGVGFILFQVAKFFFSINSPGSLAKKDGLFLRNVLGPYLGELVPLTDNELELFSLNKTSTTKRKAMYTLTTGVFKSIYHEPLMAYAYKEYRSKPVSSLLAKTHEDEFFYISMKGETRVYHNGKALGLITSKGQLLSPDGKKQLARISPEDVLTLHPVQVGGREVGKVLNPQMADTINPRAFQFLENMTPQEEKLFLSLSILSVVEESIA